MSTAVAMKKVGPLTFRSSGFFRNKMHVSPSILLLLLATGRLRVHMTSTYPLYCLEDVNAFLREERPNGHPHVYSTESK
jgi:hypothetical protein